MSVYSQIQRVVIATLTVIKNSQRAKANSKQNEFGLHASVRTMKMLYQAYK